MRLSYAVLNGAVVILALAGLPQQAVGASGPDGRIFEPRRLIADRGELLLADRPIVQDTAAAPADRNISDISEPSDADRRAATDSLPATAENQDSTRPHARVGVRLGLATRSLPFPIEFAGRLPEPTRSRPELKPRLSSWAVEWSDSISARAERWRAELWRQSRPIAGASVAALDAGRGEEGEAADSAALTTPDTALALADTTGAAADSIAQDPTESESEFADAFSRYADLGMALQGRIEMGGGWNRFRPCNVTLQLNCDPSLIPTIRPDIQFGARVGGTVTDRVHVSVDYDNRREFDAANNINVFYQGFEDEILQRVEVGDVTFPLPQSRYLTQGIPAGNFGFRATGQMGPIDFQSVWAQQKGDVGERELQLGGTGQAFEQVATTVLDDADYELGRFFFLFNPKLITGYPDIDIQNLIAVDAPPPLRPGSVVKVYRYELNTVGLGGQVPEGFITAVAVAEDTVETALGEQIVVDTLTGLFRPLVDGEDYVLHQSGLWLQLRNTLPEAEALAITYVAADGTEIGTFDAEERSDAHNADPTNVAPPFLSLVKGVNHRPGTATWTREMHHIYRVSASPGVVKSSVRLTISQGDPEIGNTFRTAAGRQLEFLKIFGLDDDPTDDVLDGSRIYQIETTAEEATAGPTGTYIVPPTLEPFRKPPPLTDVGGSLEGQPFPLVAADVNAAIYAEPNDVVRSGSNLYLLTISYRQRFEGFLSTISLGSGGVREESERVMIDNVELVRGEDYTIDYDVGQVELREPERWFGNNPDARVRVTFEQKPLFQLAPTSVFGLQARYGLGTIGELNFIGLSQREKTLQTRPELGLEPSAVQLGGVSGRLNFQPDWLTALVDALPGVTANAPSSLTIDGELAVSMPNTNTQGLTYVEDFEGGPGFSVSLLSRAWRLGAAPSTREGAESVTPVFFGAGNASELVWQDQYVIQTTEGPQIVGGLEPSQIDDELLIQGIERPEPVLTLTAKLPQNRQIAPIPDPPPGPAWRSMTNVISTTGQDFTTIEFLEFYVAAGDAQVDSISLILDLGTVSEDAWGLDSLGTPSGIGLLDREVMPPQVWTNADDTGLWETGCVRDPAITTYPLGDVAANCTANNGLEDTEDLNQNSVLDDSEQFFRYTVELGDETGRYFVREANEFGAARFRLYRIPLRRPDHRERVTDAEFQNIRHLRITMTTGVDAGIILARFRFLGSRWLKRGSAGIIEGITDTTSVVTPGAVVNVGPISTLDARYVSPPGVTDQLANQTDQFAVGGGTSFNEQSLSIAFAELGPNERTEVFLQYAQTPRDFLSYRALRMWALGAEGPWGRRGDQLRFIVKLGEDASNFYVFQTTLPNVPPDASGAELRQAWLPEVLIDFNRFIALRTRAEQILFERGEVAADTTLEVWDVDVFEDGDSSYAVVIRARPPNLAAIRQISLGAYNASSSVVSAGELWIDDIRLGSAVDNNGYVGEIAIDLRASDVLGFNFSYSGNNPYFRQLGQQPSFRSSRDYRLGGTLQFGRFLPDGWAVNMPVSLNYNNSESHPLLLPRTDVFVDELPGLRNPTSENLRVGVNLSRRERGGIPWVGWFIDNSTLRFAYDRRSNQSSRSTTNSKITTAGYTFSSEIADVSLPLFPGPLKSIFFFLPKSLKESRLRLTPQSVSLGTSYSDLEATTRRFREIVKLPDDTAAVPVRTLEQRLQNNATINLQPFTSLSGRFSAVQNRDLTPTNFLVSGRTARDLINDQRSDVLGQDVGWVTGSNIVNNLTYRPDVATWLTPQAALDTRFRLDRGASYVTEQEGDTILTGDFSNSRSLRASVGFNTPVFFRQLLGESDSGVMAALQGLLERIDIFTLSWSSTLRSNYSRQTAEPNFGYRMGFGSFVGLRAMEGDTASRVIDSELFSLSSGLRLPLGAGLSFDYSQTDARSWTPVTQSTTVNTGWPNINLSWNRLPIPGILQPWVASLGFRAGYRVQKGRSRIFNADQDRDSRNESIPLTVTLTMTTGWAISYNLTLTETERFDPVGATFGDEANHAVQLTGRFNSPIQTGTFTNPIRTSIRFTQSSRDECRRLGSTAGANGPAACEPFTDLRIRRVDFTLDTEMTPFIIGVQGSWNDTQSELGVRPGSTTLELSMFGQFLLEVGEIR